MIDMALLHHRVCDRITRLLLCSVFSAAVAAITPATASTKASAIAKAPKRMDHATSRYDKHNSGDRNNGAAYFGNWGYAPGGYYWNPNDLWHRSRGFWDTNAPGCPFRSC